MAPEMSPAPRSGEMDVDGEFKVACLVIIPVCVDQNGALTAVSVTAHNPLDFFPGPPGPDHDHRHDRDNDDDDYHD